MIERRVAKVGDIKITIGELWKAGAVVAPIMGTLVFGWINLNSTLADHTRNQNAQAEDLKKMRDDIAVISARQSATDEKVTRIMFYFRVPQEGSPFTVFPPQATQHSKMVSPPLKGHALFDVPLVIASTPLPQDADGGDHSQ